MRFIFGIMVVGVLFAATAQAAMPKPGPEPVRPHTYTIPAALGSLLAVEPPKQMPKTSFEDPGGAPTSILRFKGKRVLLFFWSAGCVPCLKTMPELDQMADHYSGKGFEVVPVSVDPTGAAGAKALFARQKWNYLKAYADPTRALASALGISMLPTTILVDEQNRATAVIYGPQAWNSPDFLNVIANGPAAKTQ